MELIPTLVVFWAIMSGGGKYGSAKQKTNQSLTVN
jgi:hypothetical protein